MAAATPRLSLPDALRFAWPACKRRFGLFATLLLTMFAAWVVLEALVIAGHRLGLVWWTVTHLAFLCFFSGLQLGLLRVCLALADGKEPAVRDAFARLAEGPRFLIAQLGYFLLVLGGCALLLLPGIYLAGRYAFFALAIAGGEPGLVQPFQKSARITAGVVGRVIAIGTGLLLLNVLGAAVLGIGLLVTVPLSLLTMTALYRQLAR
jgi:hypothetical protein